MLLSQKGWEMSWVLSFSYCHLHEAFREILYPCLPWYSIFIPTVHCFNSTMTFWKWKSMTFWKWNPTRTFWNAAVWTFALASNELKTVMAFMLLFITRSSWRIRDWETHAVLVIWSKILEARKVRLGKWWVMIFSVISSQFGKVCIILQTNLSYLYWIHTLLYFCHFCPSHMYCLYNLKCYYFLPLSI